MGAEHQVHVAVGFPHPLADPLLLGHAAAQGDDLLRVFLFRVGQDTQIAEHPLLRVLPDGAGVQNDQVCLLGVAGKGEAALLQHPHELLAVGHVLLAAEGVHAGHGVGLAGGKHGADLLLKVPLAVQVRLGDQYLFAFQKSFLRDSIL